MSRLAADCFAAAGRLQYTSFQTNSVDLNDALLVSIHDWKDAGSRELYIYDQVHMNGPPEIGRHFWGHLPLSWMDEFMLDFTLYYILFSNEAARDDDNRLWVLVLKDTRRQRPHRWTWQLLKTNKVFWCTNMSHKVFGDLSVFCHGSECGGNPCKGGCLWWTNSTTHSFICAWKLWIGSKILFATRNRTISGKSWLASCFEENVSFEGGRHHHLYLLRCQPRTRRSKRVRR